MFNSMSRVLAILSFIFFYISLVVADPTALLIQREDGPTIPSSTLASTTTSPSTSQGGNGGKAGGSSTTTRQETILASITPSSNSTTSSSATMASASVTQTIPNILGAAPTSSISNSRFNSTLTPDLLPITPTITPGFGVAGVILMLSGVVYTFVGIRNKRLHVYLSAAYLASLSVTVLIIYIMNPPVSNAIQGAYLVAITMTGFILGGAAMLFTDMTEGLGSLLGGFCLSMWLLVLKPGGLLTSTSGKSIFIACFTAVAFATSFTHYTRPYSLIVSISFAGATVIVLGIDCFSRAGLKEFWAYLWNLNDNLFPAGATTYPLTRGIRVEIAAIVIIFLAGVASQVKLWKVIKKRRDQRTADRLEDERTMEREEENVGRRIEHHNARERVRWESVYGSRDKDPYTGPQRKDSGVGDMESQKNSPVGTITSTRRSNGDGIEMSKIPVPPLPNHAGLVQETKGLDRSAITVLVARDAHFDTPGDNQSPDASSPNGLSYESAQSSHVQQPGDETVWVVGGADEEARLERRSSRRASTLSVPRTPEVVPLPFKVPDVDAQDDRSSVATFADEEHTDHKMHSKRISNGSALIRRLSRKSQRHSKGMSIGKGVSTEDLVVPHMDEDDRASSIAATLDGLSDDEDMGSDRSSIVPSGDTPEEPVRDMPSHESEVKNMDTAESPEHPVDPVAEENDRVSERQISATSTEQPTPQTEAEAEEPLVQQSLTSSTDPKPEKSLTKAATVGGEPDDAEKQLSRAPSVAASTTESKTASITKERLPTHLSKVVMSYRTNEWAKHLSTADAPVMEELKIAEYPIGTQSEIVEVPAPVNVNELQQTPENALPPPAPMATSRRSSDGTPPLSRSSSAQWNSIPSRSEPSSGFQQQNGTVPHNMQQQSLSQQNPGLRLRSSSSVHIPQQIVESPIEDMPTSTVYPKYPGPKNFSSSHIPFSNTSTFMGQRDTKLRHKPFTNSPALASNPELQSSQYSSAANSQPGSDRASIYSYYGTPAMDDDNMSLSARRDLIRQSSLQQAPTSRPSSSQQTSLQFDSRQPKRQSSATSAVVREQQLATWRASVQQDLQSGVEPRQSIDRQRSTLWQERLADEQRKAIDARRKGEREIAFDHRMRRGDMLDAHKQALRKMQASANKHI